MPRSAAPLSGRAAKGPTLSTFTPDASAALDGPAWLRDRRAAAAAAFAAAELPTTDEEVWRYSRIDELDLGQFAPAAAPGGDGDLPEATRALVAAVPAPVATVAVRNGRLVAVDLDPDLAGRGVRVGRAAELGGSEDIVGAAIDDAPDVFLTFNDAFAADPVVVDVPAGVALPGPVIVVHVAEGD